VRLSANADYASGCIDLNQNTLGNAKSVGLILRRGHAQSFLQA
jgi:hypothetical protein